MRPIEDPPPSSPVVCQGTCTVTILVDSAPITEEKALDLLDMFWGFMLAAVVVWGCKQILNFFTKDNE